MHDLSSAKWVFKRTYLHLLLRTVYLGHFHLDGTNFQTPARFVPKIRHQFFAIILWQMYYGFIALLPERLSSTKAIHKLTKWPTLWSPCKCSLALSKMDQFDDSSIVYFLEAISKHSKVFLFNISQTAQFPSLRFSLNKLSLSFSPKLGLMIHVTLK